MRDRGLIARGEAKRLAEARAKTDPILRCRVADLARRQCRRRAKLAALRRRRERNCAHCATRPNSPSAHFWDRARQRSGSRAGCSAIDERTRRTRCPTTPCWSPSPKASRPIPRGRSSPGARTLPDRWFAFRLDAGKNTVADRISAASRRSRRRRARGTPRSARRAPTSPKSTAAARTSEKTVSSRCTCSTRRGACSSCPKANFSASIPAALPVQGEYRRRARYTSTHAGERERCACRRRRFDRARRARRRADVRRDNGVATSRQLCQRAGEEGFPRAAERLARTGFARAIARRRRPHGAAAVGRSSDQTATSSPRCPAPRRSIWPRTASVWMRRVGSESDSRSIRGRERRTTVAGSADDDVVGPRVRRRSAAKRIDPVRHPERRRIRVARSVARRLGRAVGVRFRTGPDRPQRRRVRHAPRDPHGRRAAPW